MTLNPLSINDIVRRRPSYPASDQVKTSRGKYANLLQMLTGIYNGLTPNMIQYFTSANAEIPSVLTENYSLALSGSGKTFTTDTLFLAARGTEQTTVYTAQLRMFMAAVMDPRRSTSEFYNIQGKNDFVNSIFTQNQKESTEQQAKDIFKMLLAYAVTGRLITSPRAMTQNYSTGTYTNGDLTETALPFSYESPLICNAGYNDPLALIEVISKIIGGGIFNASGDFEKAQNAGSALSLTSEKGKVLKNGLKAPWDAESVGLTSEYMFIMEKTLYQFLSQVLSAQGAGYPTTIIPAARATILKSASAGRTIADRTLIFDTLSLLRIWDGFDQGTLGIFPGISATAGNGRLAVLIVPDGVLSSGYVAPRKANLGPKMPTFVPTYAFSAVDIAKYSYGLLLHRDSFAATHFPVGTFEIEEKNTYNQKTVRGTRDCVQPLAMVKSNQRAFFKVQVNV